jgi:peptidase M48-like protein
MSSTYRNRKGLNVCLFVVACLGLATATTASDVVPLGDQRRVQSVIDDLIGRLGMSASVTARIVQTNPLLASVEPDEWGDTFVLSLEKSLLDRLDTEGLRAVVAHELGHVWIFTHHPFLQTESLANSVAMRVVSRESLEKVYDTVGQRATTKTDLARFMRK